MNNSSRHIESSDCPNPEEVLAELEGYLSNAHDNLVSQLATGDYEYDDYHDIVVFNNRFWYAKKRLAGTPVMDYRLDVCEKLYRENEQLMLDISQRAWRRKWHPECA